MKDMPEFYDHVEMELKPCPFCGNKKQPVAVPINIEPIPNSKYMLMAMVCQRCYAQSSARIVKGQNDIIETWNERIYDES